MTLSIYFQFSWEANQNRISQNIRNKMNFFFNFPSASLMCERWNQVKDAGCCPLYHVESSSSFRLCEFKKSKQKNDEVNEKPQDDCIEWRWREIEGTIIRSEHHHNWIFCTFLTLLTMTCHFLLFIQFCFVFIQLHCLNAYMCVCTKYAFQCWPIGGRFISFLPEYKRRTNRAGLMEKTKIIKVFIIWFGLIVMCSTYGNGNEIFILYPLNVHTRWLLLYRASYRMIIKPMKNNRNNLFLTIYNGWEN